MTRVGCSASIGPTRAGIDADHGDESHPRFGRAACGNGLTATSGPRRMPAPAARLTPGRAHA